MLARSSCGVTYLHWIHAWRRCCRIRRLADFGFVVLRVRRSGCNGRVIPIAPIFIRGEIDRDDVYRRRTVETAASFACLEASLTL